MGDQVDVLARCRMAIGVEPAEGHVRTGKEREIEGGRRPLRQRAGAAGDRFGAVGRDEAIEIPAAGFEPANHQLGGVIAGAVGIDAAAADDARGWGATLQKLGVAATQPAADKLVVDKSEGVLKAYDADGKLIALFPATMGSHRDPLPIGTWKIQGVSRNPDFHYNPKLFWDVSDNKEAQLLQPGPNGPVGVVWLDLNKPHYGIHGTNEPHTIGRAESHGC
eukprot:gene2025-2634_t